MHAYRQEEDLLRSCLICRFLYFFYYVVENLLFCFKHTEYTEIHMVAAQLAYVISHFSTC